MRCIGCSLPVSVQDEIICTSCYSRYHFHCAGYDRAAYKRMTYNVRMSWKCGTCRNTDMPSYSSGRSQCPSSLLQPMLAATCSVAAERAYRTDLLLKEVAFIRGELKVEFEKLRQEMKDFHDMISHACNRVTDFESKIRTFENKLLRLDEIEAETEAEIAALDEARDKKDNGERRKSDGGSKRDSKADEGDKKK